METTTDTQATPGALAAEARSIDPKPAGGRPPFWLWFLLNIAGWGLAFYLATGASMEPLGLGGLALGLLLVFAAGYFLRREQACALSIQSAEIARRAIALSGEYAADLSEAREREADARAELAAEREELLAAFGLLWHMSTQEMRRRLVLNEALDVAGYFRCERCSAVTHPDDGGADEAPGCCSECWVALQNPPAPEPAPASEPPEPFHVRIAPFLRSSTVVEGPGDEEGTAWLRLPSIVREVVPGRRCSYRCGFAYVVERIEREGASEDAGGRMLVRELMPAHKRLPPATQGEKMVDATPDDMMEPAP